jgi:hypothetical protein
MFSGDVWATSEDMSCFPIIRMSNVKVTATIVLILGGLEDRVIGIFVLEVDNIVKNLLFVFFLENGL